MAFLIAPSFLSPLHFNLHKCLLRTDGSPKYPVSRAAHLASDPPERRVSPSRPAQLNVFKSLAFAGFARARKRKGERRGRPLSPAAGSGHPPSVQGVWAPQTLLWAHVCSYVYACMYTRRYVSARMSVYVCVCMCVRVLVCGSEGEAEVPGEMEVWPAVP